MPASDFDLELQAKHKKAVYRLMAADTFDEQAFIDLKQYLCEKAEEIKIEHVVSKQVLTVLLEAVSAIESRAEYLPSVRAHLGMINEFQILLWQVANGEGCRDRVPGVPRIV
jgi:hypothetical protein